MSTIAIFGLIISVAVLIVGAYRGLGALPLTLLASLVVILTNGINVWDGFATHYMNGYTGAYMSYFLLFASSSLYAELMNTSGCATSIGYQFIDWFGKKRVLLVSTLIISVLTYGGVSLFVVVYAVAPIMFLLFKEAGIPRHLTMACLITGSATYTMTSLPGTPSLANVIPTQYLGTTLTSAPVMGIICSIAMFAMCMLYMNFSEKAAKKNGEQWTYPESMSAGSDVFEIKDRSTLPAVWKAFVPMITLVLIIIIGSRFVGDGFIKSSTMLATMAMLVGACLTLILNLDKFKGKDMKKMISTGLEGGISGIGGLAGVVAFGTVVQNSAAYASIIEWVLHLDLNTYVRGTLSTMVVSAITGSSSGGLKIMYESLAESFISSGANLNILHRLTSISAGALDTLPHSPGLFLMLAVLGLNHKSAYKHVFVCSVIIPLITTIVATAFCMVMF